MGSMRGENKGEINGREADVLRLISSATATKRSAPNLDLSVKTVEAHKANAMRKLGITSRIDIVKYAILRDWRRDDNQFTPYLCDS